MASAASKSLAEDGLGRVEEIGREVAQVGRRRVARARRVGVEQLRDAQRDAADDVALPGLCGLRRPRDGAEVPRRHRGGRDLVLAARDFAVEVGLEQLVACGDGGEGLVERAVSALLRERVELRERRLGERRLARRLREGLPHGRLELGGLRGVAAGELRVARRQRGERQRVLSRERGERVRRRACEGGARRLQRLGGGLEHRGAHGLAENPCERAREGVRRLGVLPAPEHRPDGVLVALRERPEVDVAARAGLGRGLELLRERGDEPLRVRHRLRREERRRAGGVGGHQQERVEVRRDERLQGGLVARGRALEEPQREVADRLALGLRELRGQEREVLRLHRRLEMLRRIELAGLHRRRPVVGGEVPLALEEQRDLVEDALFLRAAARPLGRLLEVRGDLAVAALDGQRRAEELLELVVLRRRLGNLVLLLLRRREFLLWGPDALLRRLNTLRRRLDLLPVPAGVGDLVRVFDDVLDALLVVLVALLDFADGLGDDLDVDRIPERIVARGAD